MNINRTNYEEYLIKKLEGLLSPDELTELDSFMLKHPELNAEWEALGQTILVADEKIVFTGKAALKQPEHGKKVVPLYHSLAITISVAASLLFVVYMGVFRFAKTDAPVTVASNIPVAPSYSVVNNLPQAGSNTSTPSSTQLIAQVPAVNSPHASHHVIQRYPVSSAVTNTPTAEQTQNVSSSSVPVELASLKLPPVGATPLKMKISLLPYKSLQGSANATATNIQPTRNPEHASWVQFASVIGAELYRLSGRGELSTGKQAAIDRNDVSLSVKTKRFSFLKTFHFHPNKKTIQSK